MSRWVWGVDVAVSHLAFAFADLDSDQVIVRTLTTTGTARDGERLGLLDRQIRIAAGKQWMPQWPPYVVWVEQASGRFRAPQLVYAVGVVQAALYEALEVPVWTIPSGAWKKRIGIGGNATKAHIAAWAGRCGYDCDSQDEMDACGIAVAGRDMVADGQWEVAA